MSNPATSKPPTPRRCRSIFAAHHLDCQGLSGQQIADQLGCARSTVHAYLRDFRLHRAHILQTVAADRLADQVYLLTQPDTEPDQHRRHVAATRELRLLLLNLPAIEQHDQRRREHALAPSEPEADAYPFLQDWQIRDDADGHRRYVGGPGDGQCTLDCPPCIAETRRKYSTQPYGDPDESGPIEPEPDQPSPNPDQSGQIEPNLDNSEQQIDENPVPGAGSARTRKNSRPKPAFPPRNRPRPDDDFTVPTIDTITIGTLQLGGR